MASDKLEMRAYKLEHDAACLERLPAGERSDFTASVARAFRATSRDIRDAAAEIARLTRELEEARERERALREAHERSVGVFRRACEIAEAAIVAGETPETASARLRDAIEADIAEINALVALATPPAYGGGKA